MKILKSSYEHIEWPRKGTCPNCKSFLEVDRVDTRTYPSTPGDFEINCPVCSTEFVIYSYSTDQSLKAEREKERRERPSTHRPRDRSDSMDPFDPAWDEDW